MRAPGSVDVVVATHMTDRPVERSIASVLGDGLPDARALLVCHGLPAADVLRTVSSDLLDRVTVIEHVDGISSPAGPFNAGLDASDAEFVGIMGSDDFLEPGALTAWRERLLRTDAAVVLARVVRQGGGLVRTPPTRMGRRRERLDCTRDRVCYRTAPLGLMRANVLDRLDVRFDAGVASAEDLGFGIRLFTSGERVDYAGDAPAYVVGADAATRVSTTTRPVAADLEACVRLVGSPWFRELDDRTRRACVVKIVRIHVFGAVLNRPQSAWTPQERVSLASRAEVIVGAAPRARRAFSLVEAQLWRAVADPSVPARDLAALSVARTRHGRRETILTRDPRALLDAQAPLRLIAASALMR